MADTSLSLLDRLRKKSDAEGWQRFVEVYTPLIHGWLHRQGLPPADADDLVQEVLSVVVKELPSFQHQHPGAFRGWLRTITVHRLRGWWRARQGQAQGTGDSEVARLLEQLEDPHSRPSQVWDQEHDLHLMSKLLALIEPEFNSTDWRAFHLQVFGGKRAAEVAGELGVSVNVVLLAKSRILKRLRQEAQGLID